MIHTAKIRADAEAAPGDAIIVPKAQLYQLLDEIAAGQAARRELKIRDATASALGIDRVFAAN